MLWQVSAGFRFRLAGGRVQTSPPSKFLHPPSLAQISVGYLPVPNQSQLLEQYIKKEHVTAAIVDPRESAIWSPALDRIAKRENVGGIMLYRVAGSAPRPCPSS
jgi:hypothetical protein